MTRSLLEVQAGFAVLFLCVLFAAIIAEQGEKEPVLDADLAESCRMVLELCTAVYKKKLNAEGASDRHVCLMLQSYTRCLERSFSSCNLYRPYDTSATVASRLLPRLCLDLEAKRKP